MKIREIHTHMSVQFGPRKREERFFSVDNVKKFDSLSIELIDGLGAKISNHEDTVIIPFVNIIAIKPEIQDAPAPEPTAAEREVLGLDAEEPEAPEDTVPLFKMGK